MQIEQLKVGDLIPYVNNSRTHSDEQVMQVASSIKEFGFTNPILIDNDGGIIAGHGRLMAAKKLGLNEVPCIRLGHLSEAQRKAYVIADNQLALNSGWELDSLKIELEELNDLDFDLNILGFTNDELDSIIQDVQFDAATEDEQGQLDELDPKWCACPHCGKEFDLREHS
jgi:ParB family chromosome partitioning protein